MRGAQVFIGVAPGAKVRPKRLYQQRSRASKRAYHVVSIDLWDHSSRAVRAQFGEAGQVDLPAPHLIAGTDF
jgi:hypothetical protein